MKIFHKKMWGGCFKNSAKDKFYAVIIYGIKSYQNESRI